MDSKETAPNNRTIVLTDADKDVYAKRLTSLNAPVQISEIINKTICQDLLEALPFLPSESMDLIFADPPYNLTKEFSTYTHKRTKATLYEDFVLSWLPELRRLLKQTGSIYICGDWQSSSVIQKVLSEHFVIRNRITWEREKGRGAKGNWKNASEDIWFATKSNDYRFNADAVKISRRVIAPYTNTNGEPKDWLRTKEGNVRLTYASNFWTDLTVPFWSMAENTEHPTQKPEKLLAKVILASSNADDVIFDPFLGSGTTSVVAKKLGRSYVGIEFSRDYCCLAERRLAIADDNPTIQGYSEGIFWERNSRVKI